MIISHKFSTLRHYTNVGFLMKILEGNRLKFSNGLDKGYSAGDDAWDDQNDVMTLNLYKEITDITPLVICFTHTISIHHWEYYGKTGNFENDDKVKCAIVFDYQKFKNLIENYRTRNNLNLILKMVRYISEKDLKHTIIDKEELPFTKKYGFNVDKEERLVLFTANDKQDYFLPGIISCISNIVIYAKGANRNVVINRIKERITATVPQLKGKIQRSNLCDSETWQKKLRNQSKKLSTKINHKIKLL